METTVVVRSPKLPTPPNKTTTRRRQKKRKRSSDDDAASSNTPPAARPRIHRESSSHGLEPSLQLSGLAPTDTAYPLSSSIGSASAAGTNEPQLAPVAVLSGPGPVPGPVHLTGLQTQPQAYPHYQLHTCTSSTNSGPGPSYCSACIFYHDSGTMSIEGHHSAGLPTTYSQPFHPAQVYDPSQPGDAVIAQSHFQQVSSSPSQPVPSFYNTNATAYPQYSHPALQPQPFYTLQGLQQLQENAAPFQAPPGTSVPYTAYNGMGGGHQYPVGPQQGPIHEYHPPIASNSTGSTVSPAFPEFGKMENGATQPQDAGNAVWQSSVNYPFAQPRQNGGVEFGHDHDHNMQDDSGELDNTDTDCDICGNSPRTSVDQAESASSSDVKQEEHTPAPNSKARRNPLSSSHRKQTAETRKIKACVRCRMQKMRCQSDDGDSLGDCLGCRSFSKTSKKTIHRMPCYRGKITDAILFRSGGLELTRRWKGTEMKDVGDRIDPRDIRTISFTLGICATPIEVNVTAFRAQTGDVIARFWTVPGGEHGVRKRKDLATYCLADIQKTAVHYKEYIEKHAIDVLINERAGGTTGPRDIIERTYGAAVLRHQYLSRRPAITLTEEKERDFLGRIFIFWFAMRHSTGSSWICGQEYLGMKPETKDETYPLFGRVSVPRMILAQFDSINTHLLHKYGKRVLSELESLISRGQTSAMWYTIYLCLFILLREASWISEDRYRHARNNFGSDIRYSVPKFVEDLQKGCNNLLQHWHYFNADGWPDAVTSPERYRTNLCNLTPEQHGLVMETLEDPSVQRQLNVWRRYKAENGQVNKLTPTEVEGRAYEGRQIHYDWDHPFYWISQLYEENWQPHPTYKEEKVPTPSY